MHWLLLKLISFGFSLRYRVRVVGLKEVLEKIPKGEGGILFLPNHPSVLVDPSLVTLSVLKKVAVRPVVVDFMYYLPGVHWLMTKVRAVPIPSFGQASNTHKLRRMDLALEEVISGLEKGSNFIFYPAGKVKLTAKEQIGGASGLSKILSETTRCQVVLIRTTGLWGSRFSRAFGHEPMGKTVLWGFRRMLKNLIFFNPRREVKLEFSLPPAEFNRHQERREQNQLLENWYNDMGFDKPGEELKLVRYSAWSKKLPDLSLATHREEEVVELKSIPKWVKDKVYQELSRLTEQPKSSFKPSMRLAQDLGLDSLDASELILFLEEQFEVSEVPAEEITTVGKLLGVAAHEISYEPQEEAEVNLKAWNLEPKRRRLYLEKGKIIPELFFNTTSQYGSQAACGDDRSGVLTYSQMKMRVLLLANYIKKLPGQRVGVLLPSSVAAMIVVLACQVARKTPVMINWTVGQRHIDAVLVSSGIEVALSSWAFLDRLPNAELGGLVDKLIQLEDLRYELTLFDKLKSLMLSKRSTKSLLRHYSLDDLNTNEAAVILYTSGSEGMPKGVPLSHRNILSDIHAAAQVAPIYSNDRFLSILPPFHSFGFTVCGLTPLLLGLKVAYFANPTEGAKIAHSIDRWGATLICAAPTFFKKIFRAATKDQVKTLRLTVTGAEAAPPELLEIVEGLGIGETLLEGYGITECSPILTLNRPGEESKGVGKAIPHVDLMIVHPDSYKPLPTNERGLILVKGPNVFSGYLNREKDPFIRLGDETWYDTGDLGFLDDEGRLTISGRLKRFIKVGAEMVSLEAIERALMDFQKELEWPSTEEGPILGIIAHEVPGDRPLIYLFTTFPLTIEEGNDLLKKAGFSNLIRLTKTYQLDEIPIMGTGKVNYRVLEEQYLK